MNSISQQVRFQRGGTLMGFIVGLLIGLAAALSVAIYVTRVPVPFVDRGVSRNPAEDAQEAERNKGWNPNAALGGKEATAPSPATPPVPEGGTIVVPPADSKALPPAAAVEPKAPAVAPAASAPKTPSPPASAPAPKSSDPLGELVQSRTGQPVPDPAAGGEPFTYFVQAGAFRTPEDAESQRAKLAMFGLSADVTEREQSGRTVFRVRLGPFSQKAQAESTRDQLATKGVEAAVVRVQR